MFKPKNKLLEVYKNYMNTSIYIEKIKKYRLDSSDAFDEKSIFILTVAVGNCVSLPDFSILE